MIKSLGAVLGESERAFGWEEQHPEALTALGRVLPAELLTNVISLRSLVFPGVLGTAEAP